MIPRLNGEPLSCLVWLMQPSFPKITWAGQHMGLFCLCAHFPRPKGTTNQPRGIYSTTVYLWATSPQNTKQIAHCFSNFPGSLININWMSSSWRSYPGSQFALSWVRKLLDWICLHYRPPRGSHQRVETTLRLHATKPENNSRSDYPATGRIIWSYNLSNHHSHPEHSPLNTRKVSSSQRHSHNISHGLSNFGSPHMHRESFPDFWIKARSTVHLAQDSGNTRPTNLAAKFSYSRAKKFQKCPLWY